MFSGKDTANAAYPTQWALNPSAYQNVDSNSVDWAALAQQWIAMKEAAAIVGVSQSKPDTEEGEAPMEVENPEINNEMPVAPPPDWNSSPNNWGGNWNQWGWGWSGAPQMDPKLAADPSIAVPPMMDGYPASDNSSSLPGYTTGPVQPTFQHGYWTAPQAESASNNRSSSRSIDRRSKSKNRDSKSSRSRPHRDKSGMIPPVIEPMVLPTSVSSATIDAAKRRQLPAWIREGLEKMEREKQKAIEREEEKKVREEAELQKKKLEEEELARLKAAASGEPMLPAKSKFETDSEGEESDNEVKTEREPEEKPPAVRRPSPEPQPPAPVHRTKEEIMHEVMLAVRRSLTEILLEVTDQEIHTVSQEELARYNAAQASRLNAMKASKSKALAAIASGLGLGAYESSGDSDDEPADLSDHQLQEMIRRKRTEFERTSREIEADVRRAELRESADEVASPVSNTPERPKLSRSSATPPPVDSDTPEKKVERRNSKDKRTTHRSTDKVDGNRNLETIPEEKQRKTNKYECTPSPQRTEDKSNHKNSTNSSSSDSEGDSSSSSSTSSESEEEKKGEKSRSNKRKRTSSSSIESQKKNKKQKKEKRSSEKLYKSKQEGRDSEKSKSKKQNDYNDKHKSSRSRDYERSHRDRYRDESDDDRSKKRSKRSRSVSYESRSGRRRISKDRSEERSHRRDKRSYDRDSTKRDRSYDRSGRDYDRCDRYERSRDYDRRRSRSGSHRHRR